MRVEQKLAAMGLDLEPFVFPTDNRTGAVQVGNLLFAGGHGPEMTEPVHRGRVGKEVTIEQAYDAARACAVSCLASAREVLEDLDRIERVVQLFGMVMCTEGFVDQPKVIDGASDLFVELFGPNGVHARAAVGMYQLPRNIPVEIQMTFQIR